MTAASANATGRKPGPARQRLTELLLQHGGQGDFVTLAQRTGFAPAQVQTTALRMAREGLIERCGTVHTGARPRHVYRAAEEPGHQFMARTLLEAWR